MTDAAIQAVLAQAALCESFDATALVAAMADPAQRRAALQQLAQDCSEIERDGGFRWTMLQAARERTLAGLERETFERALAAQPDDPLARQIAAVFGGARDAAGSEPFLYRAVELLRLAQEQGAAIPQTDLETRSRETRANLDRQSATDALQGTVRGPLRGRAAPLQFLREFASGGARAIEAQLNDPVGAKLHRANLPQRRWPDVPALLVSGIGGIGKSALIAELIRAERGTRWDRRIVVHFDFDEPVLKAGDQGAMLLEFARQLALARPALDAGMSESRKRLRAGLLAIERIPTGAFEQTKFLMHAELSHWRQLLAEQNIEELLLILDTLEEVTTIDFKRLDVLFGWLDSLRQDGGLRRLHVIGSGRALVPEDQRAPLWPYFLAELELGDLSARAARAMLRDRLLREKRDDHVERVWRYIEVFGGNPLVLSILARYCVDNDVPALEALLKDAQDGDGQRRYGAAAQEFLYARILERVRDGAIRPLVYPGLVLRRVTPALICNVLAGPCGLGAIDAAQAEILLRKLQRLAWLVTPDGDGLRHRRDVRRQMLPLILEREPDRAAAVSRAAAHWLSARAQPALRDADTLESWYHRGLLSELASDDQADLRALSLHLGEDVDDLPVAVRAAVKLAGGRSLTAFELDALPQELRQLVVTRQTRTLRQEGLEIAALSKTAVKPLTPPKGSSLRPAGDDRVLPDFPDPPSNASPADRGAVADVLESSPPLSDPVQSRGSTARVPDPPPEAELVRALFATGEFERVAEYLPVLLADFGQRVLHKGSAEFLSDEPAYLAVVAAQLYGTVPRVQWWSPGVEPSLLPSDPDRCETFAQLLVLERLLYRSSNRGQLSNAISGQSPFLKWPSRLEFGDWKLALSFAMSLSLKAEISLSTLPFLTPALVELERLCSNRRPGNEKSEVSLVNQDWKYGQVGVDHERDWPNVLHVATLHDLKRDVSSSRRRNSLDWIAAQGRLARAIRVVFFVPRARRTGFSPIGLVPEFYAPMRAALQTELSPQEIAQLVAAVAAPLATWPIELAPPRFESATIERSNELLPVLLSVADYQGCLGMLFRAAAAAHPGAYRIGRARKLFDAFESAWAL